MAKGTRVIPTSMRVFVLLPLFLTSACLAQETRLQTSAVRVSPAGLSEDTLKNAEYQSEWTQSGAAKLTNGEYREQAAPGSASQTVVTLTDHIAHGSLRNGPYAAAVILVTSSGGSGNFRDLAVVISRQGKPVNVATTPLGDRIKITSLTIENGEVVVDMITQGPNDPFCCPTQRVVQKYTLQRDRLVQTSSEVIGSVRPRSQSDVLVSC